MGLSYANADHREPGEVLRRDPWDRRIDNWIGPALGCGIVCTIFVLPAVLLTTWLDYGAFWQVLKYVAVIEVGFWATVLSLFRLAAKRSTMADLRRDEIASEHPPAVVVLTRIPNERPCDVPPR